jgi:hypothetical protein
MAAPLHTGTKDKQNAAIRFVWTLGVPKVEISLRLSVQYGNRALLKSSVYEWLIIFKSIHTSITNNESSGCPSMSSADENNAQVYLMTLNK